MDPNENLKQQRELAEKIVNGELEYPALEQACQLAELVIALDDWITNGGFLPKKWIGG